MVFARFRSQGAGVVSQSATVLRAIDSKTCWLDEQLGYRVASHAFASTSRAVATAVPSTEHSGVCNRTSGSLEGGAVSSAVQPLRRLQLFLQGGRLQPSATPIAQLYHTSCETLAAAHQAEEPSLQHEAVVPVLATVLEKALRDQFPLGPHPQARVPAS